MQATQFRAPTLIGQTKVFSYFGERKKATEKALQKFFWVWGSRNFCHRLWPTLGYPWLRSLAVVCRYHRIQCPKDQCGHCPCSASDVNWLLLSEFHYFSLRLVNKSGQCLSINGKTRSILEYRYLQGKKWSVYYVRQ